MPISAHYPFRSAACQAEYHALYAARAAAWPVPSETRLLDTPAGHTHVRVSGDPAAPPLVLLHGARGNGLMWVPNIAALSARYRTYAVDTLGEMGLSVSRGQLSRPEQLFTWLDEVLAALAPAGPVSMVGMSFGGWLAARYALRAPERLRKLVLMAPAATVLPVAAGFIGRALLTLLPAGDFRRKFYHWLLHDTVQSGLAGRAQIDQYVDDWAVAERCFQSLLLMQASVLTDADWAALRVPCLYLVGEHEKVYPPRQALERLRRVAPQVQARLIPGAGHDLWVAQPEATTTAILAFLADA